jgi:hypothetical protein
MNAERDGGHPRPGARRWLSLERKVPLGNCQPGKQAHELGDARRGELGQLGVSLNGAVSSSS